MDRTHYPDADMDIYVHPVHAQEVGYYLMGVEDYRYAGGSGLLANSSSTRNTELFAMDEVDARDSSYAGGAIHDALKFIKTDASGQQLNVHLVLTISSPAETIRCTIDQLTFNHDLIAKSELQATSAAAKYDTRGKINKPWLSRQTSQQLFFERKVRYVGDSHCWTLPLDTKDVHPRGGESIRVPSPSWDPVLDNGWIMKAEGERLTPCYTVLASSMLLYKYICPSAQNRHTWTCLMR
ncbi:hypothetical protein HWV62_23853 [Athelia sp. TMB]|nr:hypothetical protein HWV62_23853 [Athelia sp. TMB]